MIHRNATPKMADVLELTTMWRKPNNVHYFRLTLRAHVLHTKSRENMNAPRHTVDKALILEQYTSILMQTPFLGGDPALIRHWIGKMPKSCPVRTLCGDAPSGGM